MSQSRQRKHRKHRCDKGKRTKPPSAREPDQQCSRDSKPNPDAEYLDRKPVLQVKKIENANVQGDRDHNQAPRRGFRQAFEKRRPHTGNAAQNGRDRDCVEESARWLKLGNDGQMPLFEQQVRERHGQNADQRQPYDKPSQLAPDKRRNSCCCPEAANPDSQIAPDVARRPPGKPRNSGSGNAAAERVGRLAAQISSAFPRLRAAVEPVRQQQARDAKRQQKGLPPVPRLAVESKA